MISWPLPSQVTALRVATSTPARKLYQPAHGRFYLVATSLVCRLPGLPDHVVDTAKGERAAFVLRRLGADGTEEAGYRPATRPERSAGCGAARRA